MIHFLKRNYPILILLTSVTVLWTVKTIFFVKETTLSPDFLLILCSSFAFSVVLLSLLILNKGILGKGLTFILYGGTSLLFYGDVVYNRYYNAILKIDLLTQAKQLRTIKDSILSLIYYSDILYWIDLPILAILIFFLAKKIDIPKRKTIGWPLFSASVAAILAIPLTAYQLTYSDQYKVSVAGVLSAHTYDLSWTFYKKVFINQSVSREKKFTAMQKEFLEKQKIQETSPYFGKFKGKNIIMVQAESLNTFPIGLKVAAQEVTPNLKKLIETSHYYPNTYLQIGRGNTSDAEFVANNSIYPMGNIGAYKGFPENDYLSFANLLNHLGYSTSAAHGNAPDFWNRKEAYKKQGYDAFYYRGHPKIKDDEIIGLGISDRSIFKQMTEIYKTENQPFFNFIVSLTSHRPFDLPEKYQLLKLPDEMNNTPTGNYLQSVRYFDESLGYFINLLKEEGIWDDTIFVVYGDHYGPLPKDSKEMKQFLNIDFNEKTRFNIPLVIHHPGEEKGIVNDGVGSQMDIYPTLTALLGIDEPLIQMGTSLDADYQQIVGFAFETTKYSFYSDDYDYIAAHQGVFNMGTCIDNRSNQPTDVEKCRDGYNRIFHDMQNSTFLLENNWIAKVFDNGKVLASGN